MAMTSAETARDGWGRARWRLRDLEGRDRFIALTLLVLILVPFAVALVRAFRDGWVPSGDEAEIAVRALDVFSRHPPLTGLPSTSVLYGQKILANHPGPMEFYLEAVPLRVLGMSAGPLLTAAMINAGFVLVALWAFYRRLGLNALLSAGVLLLAVIGSAGTAVLTDTLSSNMTMYSLLCVGVLSWALIDGDLRLLPLTAFTASYAAQQHLSALVIVGSLIGVAMVALAIQIVRRVRRGDESIKSIALHWSGAALAVAGVCWAPVVINEMTGHPGNLTAIVRFARDKTRQTLGLRSGLYQSLHAVTPPTVLGRANTRGAFFLSAPGDLRLAIGVLIIGALGVIAWSARHRSPAVAGLAFVAFVWIVAGIADGSSVPNSAEADRVNLYRWTWTAAFLTWAALGFGIALFVRRVLDTRGVTRRMGRLAPIALLTVAAIITTSIALIGGSADHNRELPAFAAEKRIATALLAKIDRHRPVLVDAHGSDATLSVAPYIIFRLVRAGIRVEVGPFWSATYAGTRDYRPRSDPTMIVVTSGPADLPSGQGELISLQPFGPQSTPQFDHLAAERSALIDRLSASARGVNVELTSRGLDLIRRQFSGLPLVNIVSVIRNLPVDPLAGLIDTDFLHLALAGAFRAPVFDKTDLERLVDLPAYQYRGTYGDEQVQVNLVTSR